MAALRTGDCENQFTTVGDARATLGPCPWRILWMGDSAAVSPGTLWECAACRGMTPNVGHGPDHEMCETSYDGRAETRRVSVGDIPIHGVRTSRRIDEVDRFGGAQGNQREHEEAGDQSKPGYPRYTGGETSCTDPERQRDCPSHSGLELTQKCSCQHSARREKHQQ